MFAEKLVRFCGYKNLLTGFSLATHVFVINTHKLFTIFKIPPDGNKDDLFYFYIIKAIDKITDMYKADPTTYNNNIMVENQGFFLLDLINIKIILFFKSIAIKKFLNFLKIL